MIGLKGADRISRLDAAIFKVMASLGGRIVGVVPASPLVH
jgi:hypothetical protein